MKLALKIIIAVFVCITSSNAQDIIAQLGSNTPANGFSVINALGDTLFRVAGDGNIGFGKGNPEYLIDVFQKFGDIAKSINFKAGSRPNSNGGNVNIVAGDGGINGSFNGGDINIIGGNSQSSRTGGNINIISGQSTGAGGSVGGNIKIAANSGGEGGGMVEISSGTGYLGSGNIKISTGLTPSSITLNKTNASHSIFNGGITLQTGDIRETGNSIELITGLSRGGNDIILTSGSGVENSDGGNIQLTPGVSQGVGNDGLVLINGSGVVSGAWTISSDRRFKKNIEPLQNSLNLIKKLEPVKYDLRKDEFPEKNFSDKRQIGLIAQDVEKIIPELVSTNPDGYKSVDYVKINVLLITAIKEQQEEIEFLKSKLEYLENSNRNIVSTILNNNK